MLRMLRTRLDRVPDTEPKRVADEKPTSVPDAKPTSVPDTEPKRVPDAKPGKQPLYTTEGHRNRDVLTSCCYNARMSKLHSKLRTIVGKYKTLRLVMRDIPHLNTKMSNNCNLMYTLKAPKCATARLIF